MKLSIVFSSVLCCLAAAAQNALSTQSSQEASAAVAAAKLLMSMPECGVRAVCSSQRTMLTKNIAAYLSSNRRSDVLLFTHRHRMLLQQHDPSSAGSALRRRKLHSPRVPQYEPHALTFQRLGSDTWQARRTHHPSSARRLTATNRIRSCTLLWSVLGSLFLQSFCA